MSAPERAPPQVTCSCPCTHHNGWQLGRPAATPRAVHRKGAARGDHQLYGVADDKGVAQQETILGVLQYGALHKLAVAVAVAGVGVLTGAADLYRALQGLLQAGWRQRSVAACCV